MGARQKVRFLTAIWGARYVEEFAQASLPSYLAPGNLPHLAQHADLEIVVLTSEATQPVFEALPAFRILTALCPVRFLYIDDLITSGCYGVTLTLAYARGMRDGGADREDTCFFFMNSDFVLADGGLAHAFGLMQNGERCVLAPTLRARSEATLTTLRQAVDPTRHVLTMRPRDLVRLTLENLHPTVIAKTVTQELLTCSTHNQVYWQVDATTLLVRHFLIFMLAIRPERPLPPVNFYCDYGFVPELVPSGRFAILDESDDFFMMELQATAQERHFLRSGISTPGEIASALSEWTSTEHRRFAATDVIFHADDLPDGLSEERARLAEFMTAIETRLRTPPVDYADHFYWVFGVQAWASLKHPGAIDPPMPPEMAPRAVAGGAAAPRRRLRPRPFVAHAYSLVLGWLRRIRGTLPNVPVWHHLWLDSRLLKSWLAGVDTGAGRRALLVCTEESGLPEAVARPAGFDVKVGLSGISSAAGGALYDTILVHIYRKDVRRTADILQDVEACSKPGASVAVFVEHFDAEADPSNFSSELAQYVDELLPSNWIGFDLRARFAGGTFKRRLRQVEKRLFRYLWPSSIRRLPHLAIAVAVWPLVGTLVAVNNFRSRNMTSRCPDYCSSALLVLTRRSGCAGADRR